MPAPNNVLNLPSLSRGAGDSGAFPTAVLDFIAIDINVTVFASGKFYYDRLGLDGIWYNIWASATISGNGPISTTIGPGCATSQELGAQGRLRWDATQTFSASIQGS